MIQLNICLENWRMYWWVFDFKSQGCADDVALYWFSWMPK